MKNFLMKNEFWHKMHKIALTVLALQCFYLALAVLKVACIFGFFIYKSFFFSIKRWLTILQLDITIKTRKIKKGS